MSVDAIRILGAHLPGSAKRAAHSIEVMNAGEKSNASTRRGFFAVSGASTVGILAAAAAPSANAADAVNPLTVHGVHNILEFGDPSQTDEQRFNAAVAYFVAARQEVTLTVSRGFLISDTLTVDTAYISLEFTTGNIDARNLPTKPAIRFINSSSSGYPYNRASVRGLRLVGPGKSTASTGILFDSPTNPIRGVGLFGLEVSGFGTGLEFGNNAYLLSFVNSHIAQCGTGVSMKRNLVNYGENIRFLGGGIGTSNLGVYCGNEHGDFHFVATSFDFNVQVAYAEFGSIWLNSSHIEINASGANSTQPQFKTAANQSAKISLIGGQLMYNVDPIAPYIFETNHTGWGGGIFLTQVSMLNTQTSTGYLCGGTGKIHLRDLIQYDGNLTGSGTGAIMPTKSANRLIDGSFDLAAVTDAFITGLNVTSRTTSAGLNLSIGGGKLVATRVGTKEAMLTFDVPCRPGATYASTIEIADSTSTGTLPIIESFVAVTGLNSLGIPVVARSDARGPTNLALSTVKASLPYTRRNGAGTWSRVAPAWATHFRLRINFSLASAGVTSFNEVVITELN